MKPIDWKQEGAEAAIRWLSRPEVIKSIGAAAASSYRRQCQRIINRARAEGCSAPRIDEEISGGESVHIPGMKLARGLVRFGEGRPTRRWTPPIAAELEDRYDTMDVAEAAACKDPGSCSGYIFQEIAMRGSREQRRRLRLATSEQLKRMKLVASSTS